MNKNSIFILHSANNNNTSFLCFIFWVVWAIISIFIWIISFFKKFVYIFFLNWRSCWYYVFTYWSSLSGSLCFYYCVYLSTTSSVFLISLLLKNSNGGSIMCLSAGKCTSHLFVDRFCDSISAFLKFFFKAWHLTCHFWHLT